MNDTITAYVIVKRDDPTDRSRIEIPRNEQWPDNRYARRVFDGLVYKVDFERYRCVTEYRGGRTSEDEETPDGDLP